MCTVVVSLAPAARMPLLLLGIRDELTGRPWRPPARHWPGSPLIGGLDEQAGGTWLAVHPDLPRVGCILNGRGETAPARRRRSRGELPLRAAQEGRQALRTLHADPDALASYDPFYLVCADPAAVLLLSWDGRRATLSDLGPATHVLTNAGRMYPPASAGPNPATPPTPETDPKAAHFGPRFAARRPSGDPAATIKDAWGDWLTLAGGDDLPVTAPGAIIVRRDLPDGRVYGSTSVSLVALPREGAREGTQNLRYDFQPVPADPTTWYSVDTLSRGAAEGRTPGISALRRGRTSSG
jgi:transport and Golgi organization protein 2